VLHELYPQRKQIRIAHDAYHTAGAICSITIVTNARRAAFQELLLTDACVQLLADHAGRIGVPIYAYCFMPDHLHLLLSASERTSLFRFVGAYKSLSTRLAWQHGHHGRLWQDRFFDHFLRREEDVEHVIQYILNNPVRAGLVGEWLDYPFCGSLVYKL
jgi:putative transposase